MKIPSEEINRGFLDGTFTLGDVLNIVIGMVDADNVEVILDSLLPELDLEVRRLLEGSRFESLVAVSPEGTCLVVPPAATLASLKLRSKARRP